MLHEIPNSTQVETPPTIQEADIAPATEQSLASPTQSDSATTAPKTDDAAPSEDGQTIEIRQAPLPPVPDTLPPTPVSKSLNSPSGIVPTPPRPLSVSGQRPSSAHHRSLTMSQGGKTLSVVLISSALETISASKEAKRSAPLRDSTAHALEMIRAGNGGDQPREIFEPLRLACETRSEKLMIASLDCIAKLISYSFFAESDLHPYNSPPPSPGPRNSTASAATSFNGVIPLADLVVQTITSCHTESTPETVSLQIVKALLSIVLSPTILVHHSSLLKAVRTVYNVFLLSTDPVNQTVAQGGLTQMVHHVFTRCQSASEDSGSHHTVNNSLASAGSIANPENSTRSPSSRGSLALPVNGSTTSLPALDHEEATNGDNQQESDKTSTENMNAERKLTLLVVR
jgi:brefeldin A-inhibited guanine nucleotide-exchange protein